MSISQATYNDYAPGDWTCKPRLIMGSDGAYSSTREAMLRLMPMNFKREYITHGYKELCIPPTKDGEFAMSCEEALHIWYGICALSSGPCTMSAASVPGCLPWAGVCVYAAGRQNIGCNSTLPHSIASCAHTQVSRCVLSCTYTNQCSALCLRTLLRTVSRPGHVGSL